MGVASRLRLKVHVGLWFKSLFARDSAPCGSRGSPDQDPMAEIDSLILVTLGNYGDDELYTCILSHSLKVLSKNYSSHIISLAKAHKVFTKIIMRWII